VTLFEKIIARQIPANIIYEDDSVVAFRDINPQAPTHFLVVPRRAIPMLAQAGEADAELLGRCLLAAARVAKAEGLEGYRVVVNNGEEAGQTVFHLHVHVLGGRRMGWPPG
jgi:histidine triad (HIT) family protein